MAAGEVGSVLNRLRDLEWRHARSWSSTTYSRTRVQLPPPPPTFALDQAKVAHCSLWRRWARSISYALRLASQLSRRPKASARFSRRLVEERQRPIHLSVCRLPNVSPPPRLQEPNRVLKRCRREVHVALGRRQIDVPGELLNGPRGAPRMARCEQNAWRSRCTPGATRARSAALATIVCTIFGVQRLAV